YWVLFGSRLNLSPNLNTSPENHPPLHHPATTASTITNNALPGRGVVMASHLHPLLSNLDRITHRTLLLISHVSKASFTLKVAPFFDNLSRMSILILVHYP
ncbi:MAG: hypothetical protein U9N12_01945, partial [Euryarchaeota archaeon]|nr:hypothetical protein [Euryarchaeota archaeon]